MTACTPHTRTRAVSRVPTCRRVNEALTTEQIDNLLEEMPEWPIIERESYQDVPATSAD